MTEKFKTEKPVLLMLLALVCGWAWLCFSPDVTQAQSTPTRANIQTFVDSRGDTMLPTPSKQPFIVIEGYPEYKVGPGDILEIITVEGNERQTENVRIQPDGTVAYSVVHAVPVRDLALSQVRAVLQDSLALYVRDPQVQVFVVEYNSRSAAAFGSINLNVGSEIAGSSSRGPGIYALRGRVTALDLIMQAGGPTQDARLDQVRLTRTNRTYLLNLQIAVTQGDTRQNVILEDGDFIQITGTQQADRRVAILGEVSEPGVANLSNQSNMLEAIAAANGFTTQAAPNRIRIIRTDDPNNPTIITVNANRIFKGDLSQNISVEDGDIIVVPQAYGYDLQELMAEISPILNFGGLISTGPMVSLSGYNWNVPGANQGTATTTADAAAALSGGGTTTIPQTATTRDFAQEQRLIQQVQQNLTKPSTKDAQ